MRVRAVGASDSAHVLGGEGLAELLGLPELGGYLGRGDELVAGGAFTAGALRFLSKIASFCSVIVTQRGPRRSTTTRHAERWRGPGPDEEPPLEEVFPQIIFREGLHVIAYPAMLDVPTELAEFLAGLLAAERVARGTRTGSRALSYTDQAVFALVWFRESRDIPLIGKGLGISQATAYRYLDEAIGVLAARAPDLHDALRRGHDEGWSPLVLDGKVVDHRPAAGQEGEQERHDDRCLVLG
ncbi:MAG: hypothetical protein ACRDT0_11095 [Pseudonocardiaceae bacterium]